MGTPSSAGPQAPRRTPTRYINILDQKYDMGHARLDGKCVFYTSSNSNYGPTLLCCQNSFKQLVKRCCRRGGV